MPTTLLACSRMYNMTPAVAGLWTGLFKHIAQQAGIALQIIPHAAPAPLEDLWSRDDLGLAFICGRPFLQYGCRHKPVAVPLPNYSASVFAAPAFHKPEEFCSAYRTLLLVRAEDGPRSLEDCFSGTLGFMAAHSQSGYNALRARLAPCAQRRNTNTLFAASKGPYASPRALLTALAEGEVDLAPVDSYVFELCRRHDPRLIEHFRPIDATDWTPMPFLAASAAVDDNTVHALADACLALSAGAGELLNSLGLKGFTRVCPSQYALLARQEALALDTGYLSPA